MEKLTSEVAQLEKAFDGTDLQTLEKLTAKQGQIATMTAKVAEFGETGKIAEARNATFHRLMLECNTAFRPYFSSFCASIREQIETTIRPLLRNNKYRETFLEEIVNQMHILSEAEFWARQLSNPGDPRACVLRFEEIFRLILDSREIWTFDADPEIPIAPKAVVENPTSTDSPAASTGSTYKGNVIKAKSHAERSKELYARRKH